MRDLIQRTITLMGQSGVTVEDIYHMLVEEEGLSEYDAYLTYIGAKMLYKTISEPMTFGQLTHYHNTRMGRRPRSNYH